MSQLLQTKVELLHSQHLSCGESPLYDYEKQILYWVDSAKEGVYSYNFLTSEVVFIPTPMAVTFVSLRQDGGLVLGSTAGVFVLPSAETAPERVFSASQALVQLNDAIADPHGRIFTGQEAYTDETPHRTGFLFRLSPDGSVDIVEEGLSISNGMGFSPDLSTFYLIDTIARKLYAYDYHVESGNISRRRVLRQFQQEEGLPDGMTVDEEGLLWVAMWFGAAVLRIDPEGKTVTKLKLPFTQPTSVCFGGRDLNQLYITSAANLWKTSLAPPGHDYQRSRGGAVYQATLDIRGRKEYMSRF
ncbi:MAG: SMP-30/gluconolactonase/LRE family protein [Cyclobacteriaceae bacterium]